VNVNVQVGAGQIAVLFFLIAAVGAFIFLQLNKIERLLKKRQVSPATRIWLALPTVYRKGTSIVANFPLLNDEVYNIPILTKDANGDVVPAPAGDVFSVVSSDPTSLGVAIGQTASGAPACIATPLKQTATGITITLSDSDGLTSDIETVDIGPDVAPKSDFLNLAGATTTPQAVPPA